MTDFSTTSLLFCHRYFVQRGSYFCIILSLLAAAPTAQGGGGLPNTLTLIFVCTCHVAKLRIRDETLTLP